MRQIKFRAWDNQKKKMILDVGVFDNMAVLEPQYVYDSPERQIVELKGSILMQFTGLLDKNGKEIYEGDIVEWDDDSLGRWRRRCEVIYTPAHYRLVGYYYDIRNPEIKNPIEFECGSFHYEKRTEKELEIIGNIYENPELLVIRE